MYRFLRYIVVLCLCAEAAFSQAQQPVIIHSLGDPQAIKSSGGDPKVIKAGPELAIAGFQANFPSAPSFGGMASAHVLNSSKYQSIRKNGTIYRVKIQTSSIPATLDTFIIKVWRPGAGYKLVGESENIAYKLASHTLNYVRLKNPIDSVKEGDMVGFYFRAPGNSSNWLPRSLGSTGTVFIANSGQYPTDGFNWADGSKATPTANEIMPIGIYMDRPWGVSISNSIFEGVNTHFSYLDLFTGTDRPNCTPCRLTDSLGVTIHNHGLSGNQPYAMLNRFGRDVRPYSPKVVLIEAGHNPINGYDGDGVRNYPQFHASITTEIKAFIDSVVAIGAVPVWTDILPSSQLNTTQKCQTRDSVNATIGAYVISKGGVRVNATSQFGQSRSGGPGGNLWDPIPGLFDDGVHFNHAGAKLMTEILLGVLRPLLTSLGP